MILNLASDPKTVNLDPLFMYWFMFLDTSFSVSHIQNSNNSNILINQKILNLASDPKPPTWISYS